MKALEFWTEQAAFFKMLLTMKNAKTDLPLSSFYA
jgi:hypothetical protein